MNRVDGRGVCPVDSEGLKHELHTTSFAPIHWHQKKDHRFGILKQVFTYVKNLLITFY